MTDRRRPVVAWTVLAVTSLLTVASGAGWAIAAPPWDPWMLYSLVDLLVGAVYGVVAWLMLSRRSHPAAWIVAAAGVGGALSAALAVWAMLGSVWPGLLPAPVVLGGMYWLWIPGYYALTVVLPWLLPIRRFGRLDRLAISAGVAFIGFVLMVTLSDPAQPWRPLPDFLDSRDAIAPWLNPVWFLLTVLAAAGVLARRRATTPPGRRGLGWLSIGILLLALAILPLALASAWGVPVYGPLAPSLMLAAQAFFPAAVLVVVLRQRLWGMEIAVRRALVWGLMTCVLIGSYTLGVLLLDLVVGPSSALPQILVTATLAAAFQPVRQWIQLRVDRLVHGETGQPLIRHVADQLRMAPRGQLMLSAVCDGIARSLRLEAVTITPAPPPSPSAPAVAAASRSVGSCSADPPPASRSAPSPAGEGWVAGAGDRGIDGAVSVRLAGEDGAWVMRAWPKPGERLGRRATSALTDLAPVVTALVELANAQDEIDRARDSTARARDEERRRLRRDLHDGLGPALSGLSLGMAAVGNMLHEHRHDPALGAAGELIGQLAAEAERQSASVRDLARELLPPLLDDGALSPALDQLRERYAAAGLAIEVQAPAARLPGDLATAVYGIIAEAVRNVYRHANVDRCSINILNGQTGLEVSVTDHGVGMDALVPSGVGNRSMRERADGVGGRLTITSSGGAGTRVHLLVPRTRQ
jgi:signal transduction histidine kinase